MDTVLISPDMLREIMLHLDANALIQLCSTNKLAKTLCDKEEFWLKKLHRDQYWEYSPNVSTLIEYKPNNMSYRDFYLNLGQDKLHLILVSYPDLSADYMWLNNKMTVQDIEALIGKERSYDFTLYFYSNNDQQLLPNDFTIPLDQLIIIADETPHIMWDILTKINVARKYRNTYQNSMARQAQAFRFNTTMKMLSFPVRPIFDTQ